MSTPWTCHPGSVLICDEDWWLHLYMIPSLIIDHEQILCDISEKPSLETDMNTSYICASLESCFCVLYQYDVLQIVSVSPDRYIHPIHRNILCLCELTYNDSSCCFWCKRLFHSSGSGIEFQFFCLYAHLIHALSGDISMLFQIHKNYICIFSPHASTSCVFLCL